MHAQFEEVGDKKSSAAAAAAAVRRLGAYPLVILIANIKSPHPAISRHNNAGVNLSNSIEALKTLDFIGATWADACGVVMEWVARFMSKEPIPTSEHAFFLFSQGCCLTFI